MSSQQLPLSPSQRRIWFAEQLSEGQGYQIFGAYEIIGDVDVEGLRKAFSALGRRHDALRLGIQETKLGPMVLPEASAGPDLEILYTDEGDVAQALGTGLNALARPLNLQIGESMRALLIILPDASQVLVYVLHHLVADGISRQILERDIEHYYAEFSHSGPMSPELPSPGTFVFS